METIHGFWTYVAVVVPVYFMVFLVAVTFFRMWLEYRMLFLTALFTIGLIVALVLKAVHPIQVQMVAELGMHKSFLACGVGAALAIGALALFFNLRSEAIATWYWWRDRRSRRSATK